MHIALSDAQREIARRFGELLGDELAPEIRRMGERAVPATAEEPADAAAARAAVWRALVDLGATRLLLPERHGGEGAGQQEAVVLAELLGTVLYQGPLLDTLTAGDFLVESEPDGKRLAELAEGAAISLAVRENGRDHHGKPGPLDVGAAGDTVRATRRFVGFVPESRYLLVAGTAGTAAETAETAGASGPAVRCVLVPRDHPTVSCRRHEETGRGELYAVRFAATPVLSSFGGEQRGVETWPGIVARARIRHAAYLVGLGQGALGLAARRATERHQFGRALGRFQAWAFRLAELATRLEGARWLVRSVAWETDQGRDPRLGAAQALAMAADLAGDITVTAMQLHGAYGVTEAADIQIYYRRAHIDRAWMGTAADLRREVVPLLAEAHRTRHAS